MMDEAVADARIASEAISEITVTNEAIDGEPHLRIDWICDPKQVKSVIINMSKGTGHFIGNLRIAKDLPISESGKGTYLLKMTDLDVSKVKRKHLDGFWAGKKRIMVIGERGKDKHRSLKVSEKINLTRPE